MNAQTKQQDLTVTDLAHYEERQMQSYPQHRNSTTSLVLDPDAMDKMMQLANIMAKGVSTIPRHLQGNASDCLAVIMQSMQWKMNPYAVAQKTYTVNGTLGYEAQLVNAVITSIAPVKGRLNYEWFGDWEKVTGKFEIKRGDKGEYRVPGWKLADEQGLGVRVWGTIIGEDQPRVLELLLAQARTRNSTLWADDPQLQLAYLALKKWSRLHTPDVILGVYTPDEMQDFEAIRDITPPKSRPQSIEDLGEYPQDEFDKNFPSWEKAIRAGRANTEFIASKVETKGRLTAQQRNKLMEVEQQANNAAQEGEQQ